MSPNAVARAAALWAGCWLALPGCFGQVGGAEGSAASAGGAFASPGAASAASRQASVQAFSQTVEPLVDANCAGCHAGAGPGFPAIAHPDPATAHDAIVDLGKVNLASPSSSRLVQRLVSDRHNCWSDCISDGVLMGEAIAQWAALLGASAGASSGSGGAAGGGAASQRYDDHAIALWDFQEGAGNVAQDVSGVAPAIDLTLSGGVSWLAGQGLAFAGGKAQASAATSRKLYDRLADTAVGTQQYSVEAWVTPASAAQPGPAPIVSYSQASDSHNFALGQVFAAFEARNRNAGEGSASDGTPALQSADGALEPTLQHVLLTYDPFRGRRLYVDGEWTGDVDPAPAAPLWTWSADQVFVLANETSGDHPWQGSIQLVAIHDMALSEAQVQQNFLAGVATGEVTAPEPAPELPCAEPCTPPSGGAPVVIDDLDGDGRHTGADIAAALALCDPAACSVLALPVTYEDVAIVIPFRITGTLSFEGAGVGATVLRAPVPFTQPALLWVQHPLQQAVFRHMTLDGRKGEQPSYESPYGTAQGGVFADSPWGIDVGPGMVEDVEVMNMLTTGIGLIDGRNWIVRDNNIHDIGCSERLPCPALLAPNPQAQLNDPTWWTVGIGVALSGAGSSGGEVYGNDVRDVVKIGIEAYMGAEDFTFYGNAVRYAGSGIVSNGGSRGVIADNLVEGSIGHGMGCGSVADDLVFDHNTVMASGAGGLSLQCAGDGVVVLDNEIRTSCMADPGVGTAAHLMAGQGVAVGSGWVVRGNTFDGTNCGYALSIAGKDALLLEDDVILGGQEWGLYVQDVHDVLLRSSSITGLDNDFGIVLLEDVDGFTAESDVAITGYTIEAVRILDPATVRNVTIGP